MTLIKTSFEPGVILPLGAGTAWWRILDVDRKEGTALLIADRPVCDREYHKKYKDVTWKTCDLRKWLNGEYYENTFSEEEKDAIVESELENPDNPQYKIHGGNNTKDRIFLLSIEEAKKYFKGNEDRNIGRWWWLRSPGRGSRSAANVFLDGSIYADGDDVNYGRAVRPAFRINLKSKLFQSMILQETDESIMVQFPDLKIRGKTLLSAYPGLKTAKIPEGVTEISKESFKEQKNLTDVTFPSTLKKIGAEAFSGCEMLVNILGADGAISYGKDVFENCKKLEYTRAMFRNAGKLCDSFAEHLDVCGTEELAMVWMYQSGKCWEEKLPRLLTVENAEHILAAMTKHLQEKGKSIKKPAEAAAAFVKVNVKLLSKETIKPFLEMLEINKMAALSRELKEDPAVNAVINGNQNGSSKERVTPDGSILYGCHLQKIEPGADLVMGKEPVFWRILEIDHNTETALLIADKPVCDRKYHEKCEDVTWEICDLRKWLNKEYYESVFSEEEKEAIIETELENPDNPQYKTCGGNNTKDRIFLLSIEEAEKYFKDTENQAMGSWWLRSPGSYNGSAANVYDDESIHTYGYSVNWRHAVRPAFRINLKSELFQSMIQRNEDGDEVLSTPDLIIRNGMVISASRKLQAAELPSYVEQIGPHAFFNCPDLVSVSCEGAITKIDENAFWRCPKLGPVSWNGKAPEIHKNAFYRCPVATLPADYFLKGKTLKECFADYTPDNPEVWAFVLLHPKTKVVYLHRMFRHLTKENASLIAEKILNQIENGKALNNPNYLMRFILAVQPWIGEDQRKHFKELLEGKKEFDSYTWLLKYDPEAEAPEDVPSEAAYWLGDQILEHRIDDSILFRIPSISHVLAAAGDYAEMYRAGYVDDKEYKKGVHKQYKKHDKAVQLARSMDHTALSEILLEWGKNEPWRGWYAPYAAFANEEELAALIAEMKTWEKDKTLRAQIIRVRGAILLNDTVTAMRYADSIGQLEYYASLRGEDADSIRDSIISDFGLDEQGKKTWTLAGRLLTAILEPDLSLVLEDEDGKELKSVPKKGADPKEYELVKNEFSAMKKNIRSTAKTRNDRIFEDFLSGRERPGNAWKSAYLKNPVLRMLARLIIWEQEKITFILDENGTARCVDGSEYMITDEPVRVAHPMEMNQDEVDAWQSYFTENGLKQPFEQIWEPVADASQVKPGRYDGCTIPLYMLMNKDKHGIIMEGQSQITLKDCTAGLKYIEGHHDWINNEFEVTDFTFEKYTRQVNHIVVHLDKGTVAGRIKKDDISAAQWFDRFTQAQITEFISLALENNAVNVLAQLMEYKNTHFPDVDPMDRFTLDW